MVYFVNILTGIVVFGLVIWIVHRLYQKLHANSWDTKSSSGDAWMFGTVFNDSGAVNVTPTEFGHQSHGIHHHGQMDCGSSAHHAGSFDCGSSGHH